MNKTCSWCGGPVPEDRYVTCSRQCTRESAQATLDRLNGGKK